MSLIKMMESIEELEQVYPVMSELRSNYTLDAFITQCSRQFAQGYRLAALVNFGEVMSVAGLRVSENLGMGKFLYVDDLVTAKKFRSQGCGKFLLSWIKAYAKEQGCAQLHLDSYVTRHEAHRFYLQQRLHISGHHFYVDLDRTL